MFCLWEMIPDLWGATNNPQPMKPYLITGPESLLKAAYEEIRKSDVPKFIPSSHEQPFECLYLYAHGYWLDACVINGNETKLTLPVDWDKLMGILAELKKPKLPEYVKDGSGKVLKVITEKWA